MARRTGCWLAAAVDHYLIWCDTKPDVGDLDFVAAVDRYLGWLAANGHIESHRITRRKLGFGPPGLGDWMIDIQTRDLAQLESAFQQAAARAGEVEDHHSAVFSKVRNTVFGLYRDFPDAVRAQPA